MVLEYHYLASTASTKYSAVIRLLPWPLIETRLKLCFQHVNSALFPEDSEEDPEVVARKSSTAKGMLTAVFRDRPEFRDDGTIKALLSSSTQTPLRKDVRAKVLDWAYALYVASKHEVANRTLYFETSAQLWERIMPYARGQGNRSATRANDLWPFVELVECAKRPSTPCSG